MEGNNLKRKKRKTRKCLDELRKKSRLADTSEIVAESSIVLPGIHKKSLYNKCNNITKGRLTLKHGMFSKGVRSETATRAGLNQEFIARRDEDLLKIIDLANGGPSHTITSGAYEKMSKKRGSAKPIKHCSSGSDKSVNRTSNISTKDEAEVLIIKDTPQTKIEDSPCSVSAKFTKQEKQVIKKFHILTPSTETSSTSSSDTDCSDSTENSDYYQTFIKNFPKITAKTAPQFNDLTAFEKTKQFLRNVYEKCHQNGSYDTDNYKSSSEETNAHYSSLTSIDAALMNPIEYLKRNNKTNRKQEKPGHINILNVAHNNLSKKKIKPATPPNAFVGHHSQTYTESNLNMSHSFSELKKYSSEFITHPCLVPTTNINNMQRDATSECNALLLRGLLQRNISPNEKTNDHQMLKVKNKLNFKGLFQKQAGVEGYQSGMHQTTIRKQTSPKCWAQSTTGTYHQLMNQQNVANSYFCHTQKSFGMPPFLKHSQINNDHLSKNIMSSQFQTNNKFYNFSSDIQKKTFLDASSLSNKVHYQYEPQNLRVNKNFYNQNKADFIHTSNENDSDSPLYEIVLLSSSSSSSSESSHDFGMLEKGTDLKLYYNR